METTVNTTEQQFELSCKGEVKFTGNENDCYIKLQRLQGRSANWAMKYDGWKIEPVTEAITAEKQPKSFTRQDRLANKCTHREYYAQFVTENIKDAIKRRFGKSLLNSTDPHLNDIPLSRWDAMAPYVMRSGFSLSDCVCTLKEAAKQVIEENK